MDLITGIIGNVFAGSSEGIQIEYIAVFLAVLFPGALVAFNHELLQALPRVAALRIYCAGIWHNAAVSADVIYLCLCSYIREYHVCAISLFNLRADYLQFPLQFCAVCALALFLLPLMLYPIYIHGESPMVLSMKIFL